jgi:hypothetical protein
VAVCLIHETGTARSGDQLDDLAIYISRFARTGNRTGCGPSTSTPSTVSLLGENPGTPEGLLLGLAWSPAEAQSFKSHR